MQNTIKPAAIMLFSLTVLTGVIYPLTVTLGAQLLFPEQANGSLISNNDKIIGSQLIGQSFTRSDYFWSRPSATSPAYNGGASSGSNLGATNPALISVVKDRIQALRAVTVNYKKTIPADLVTASASGLDPHISPAAADYQVERIAKARHLAIDTVRDLVRQHTENRQWGIFGETRINVLALNLALDKKR